MARCPRLGRRGYSVEASRGAAAAATWIFRGDTISRRRYGDAPGRSLFVDTTDPSVLAEFASFFERPDLKKVWHNYGFDRHVVENAGLELRGFAGDTMHMARLFDSSRLRTHGGDGYSCGGGVGERVPGSPRYHRETSRDAAAAASWIFRGDAAPPRPRAGYSAGTRPRRGCHVDIP